MVSSSKLFQQLDALERELRETIVPHLSIAASGHNDLIFCVPEFNPFPSLAGHTDPTTESLISLSRKILRLREKLGEPTDNTIAARICWYCVEWGDIENSHRKAAASLARQFLEEIERSASEH
ncbi:MAG: hypothetical protein AAGH76_03415 [Pseudomonadota bacterium]